MALEKIGLEAVIEGMSQFARDAANLNQSYLDFAKNSRIMQEANRDASGALRTFGIDLNALDSPLTAIAGLVKDSIDLTIRWGDEIDKLSRTTGVEAREASKLAIIFGDFGISTGQLELAIKTLSKRGLELNIDTLKKLAAQYQALPTAVEKNEFAIRMFGRAGLDMTEILSKTSDQLDQLSTSAEMSGKVMGTEGVEGAQAMRLQLAQLQDQADGLKIQIGSALIPTVSAAATAWEDLTRILELNRLKNMELTHQISEAEYQMRAARVAGMDLNTVVNNLSGGYDIENARVKALTASTQDATVSGANYDYMMGAAVTTTESLDVATQKLNEERDAEKLKLDEVNASTGALTLMQLYNRAEQGLDADAALELGRALGVVNENTYATIKSADGLKAQLVSGQINIHEYTAGIVALSARTSDAKGNTDALGASINSLPTTHNITVTTTFITVGGEPEYGGAPGQGGRRQHGGGMFPGGTYTVGEAGPETVVMGYGHATVIPSVSHTNNFNYSPTYGGAPASPSHDFSVMQALV